ncbi:hypothetical protein [Pseudomonas lundensis]|uniref:hypothetical protein n=1 Tax=Pseudomonas lundensis TaxID=86185 RepID=UPI001474442E|nr:hypothetical protein [Pseudomonas lundensis]NNA02860.1 hypothetical protein [Pseudomonas lundensis]
MNIQERDHKNATTWIEGEIEDFVRNIGTRNASAAATSVITLAFMLRAIDDAEQRCFRARIDQLYAAYNDSLVSAA